MIGLAILFWKGWWWPGMLVLIAISMLVEGVIMALVPGASEPETRSKPKAAPRPIPPPTADRRTGAAPKPQRRVDLLPARCPGCGAQVREDAVAWTTPQTAECQYCGTRLPMQEG
jgi:DNA-directed RNA polymerase subunit RPC12/RpoP